MNMDTNKRLLKAMDRIRDENTKVNNENIRLRSTIKKITKGSKSLSNYN